MTDKPAWEPNAEGDVPLDFPVTFDSQKIEALTMRRPKMADNIWAEKFKGTDLARGMAFIARLTDQTPEFMAELDEFDANRLNEQLEFFRSTGAS